MAAEESKTIHAALAEIAQDASLTAEAKGKVLSILQPALQPPLQSDKWIYRLVVIFLGVVVMSTVLGGIIIVMTGQTKPLPDGIVAIGSAAIGALAGLLAPSPVSK